MTTETREEAIGRIAHGFWEAEGRPEGRAEEHWRRACESYETGGREARAVQPGFTEAAPGMVPEMKPDPGPELDEGPGGRFARQIDEAPETPEEPRGGAG